MSLKPIYTSESVQRVFNLKYSWSGWLREAAPYRLPIEEHAQLLLPVWQEDGIRLESFRCQGNMLLAVFDAQPSISPVIACRKIKGRLDHSLRQDGATRFSRKVSFRSLGVNTRDVVESYVARQVRKSNYGDPRFREFLSEFTVMGKADLADPYQGASSNYWYNLHLVIALHDRSYPVTRPENFVKLRDACFQIAKKKGYVISCLSIMPDHIHLALRGNVEHSPEEIALSFMNNLSFVLGFNRIWSEEYYAGTFSEYDVRAVKQSA
jgi:REP element-mobilizing transposase RayT